MKRLAGILGPDKLSFDPETLLCYGYDASGVQAQPSVVAWPESAQDVIEISRFAYENSIPICPRGAGTGMTGGASPLSGSIVISFERMNRILEIDKENMTAVVQPGVVNGDLQREVRALGLFYPPDPASMNFCTIGGNVAENAGGPRAVKYGVTRDYVLEIESVLPDGRLFNAGVRTAKGVVGYDLARLLTGSEGTLCTMTRFRLKLIPQPEAVKTLLAFFKELKQCGTAVSRIMASGIIPRTLELMDRETIMAVDEFRPTGFPAGTEAALLIELDGHPSSISSDSERTAEICVNLHAEVRIASSEAEAERLWEARRSISPALFRIAPTKISEDIVVPRSRIPETLTGLQALSRKSGIKIVCFGHAGDGNLHVNMMIDRRNPEEMDRAHNLIKEIFALTLDFGGTISGEHGVGVTKKEFIGMEIKQPAMDLMKGIKRLFDPKNIMNPGKIFPEP